MGKWCFLRNSNNRKTVKSFRLVKKRLGLVEMTSGLVSVSFSLLKWQAVKMIFFAPCLHHFFHSLSYIFFFNFRINALEEQLESQKLTTGKQVEEESLKYKLALVGLPSISELSNHNSWAVINLTFNKILWSWPCIIQAVCHISVVTVVQ